MLIAHPKNKLPEAPRLTEKERWQATKAYRDPRRWGKLREAFAAKPGEPTRTELKRQRAAAKALRRQVAKELKRGAPP